MERKHQSTLNENNPTVWEKRRHQRRNRNSKEQMLEKIEGQEARALMGELIPPGKKRTKED